MSWLRAYAIACLASLAENGIGWGFQSNVAKFMLGSGATPAQVRGRMRTIQRAVRQAKRLGVLVSRRLRRGERPPGARQPITCGGALRRFIGWGAGKAQALALRARYAVRWEWREAALKRELAAAVAEFRGLSPP
jgi:hypothetical protein